MSVTHAASRRVRRIAGTLLLGLCLVAGGSAFAAGASAATVTNNTPPSQAALTSHLHAGATTQVSLASVSAASSSAFSYNFTPDHPTFSATDQNGRLEASYDFQSAPGIFSWRYEVNPAICAGGTGATASADVYNNGGLVPNTHYSKVGVTPCYGFHASYKTQKINNKGNYQLRGTIRWRDGNATLTLNFTFNFTVY